MNEIVPGLWVGDLACALSPTYLRLARITHVVNATKMELQYPSLPREKSGSSEQKEEEEQPQQQQQQKNDNGNDNDIDGHDQVPAIYQVPLDDVPSEPILLYFDQVNRLLHSVLQEEGTNILVHCQAGMSRSPTVCPFSH